MSWDTYKVSIPDRFNRRTIVLNFHDHYSRVNKPYLIQSESETPVIIGKYLGWMGSKGTKVCRFHTDIALAFVSKRTRAVIADHGAHFTTISENVPRQNGVCERQWRTMGLDVRALLAQARLPKSYWWMALNHSCQVSAMLPWRDQPHMSYT